MRANPTPRLANTRCERKRQEVPIDLELDPNKNEKNKDDDEAREDPLFDLPEWLEEFNDSSAEEEGST